MTESKWLASIDPTAMLHYVMNPSDNSNPQHLYPPSSRSLRLFAVACARLYEGHAKHRPVLDVCERVADGRGRETGWQEELERARKSIDCVWGWTWAATSPNVLHALKQTLIQMRGNVGSFYRQEEAAAALRDIVGNPWRPWCVAERKYERTLKDYQVFDLEWLTPDVLTLAEAAYTERKRVCPDRKFKMGYYYPIDGVNYAITHDDCRGTGRINDGMLDPFRLALLSDALEEAGCQDETLLLHLRGRERVPCVDTTGGVSTIKSVVEVPLRSPHVRGCWALDLILGKE